MSISSVSIIGSGNVATHLAKTLFKLNFPIVNICSRNIAHSSSLASQVGALAISDIGKLLPVDLIIISVTDSVIAQVSNTLKTDAIVVHTSGSTSIDVLMNQKRFGVLYPFQSFSKDIQTEFEKVPVFIEANNEDNYGLLKEFATKLTSNVRFLNSEHRLKLHLSAVFANNFTNHMYTIAGELLAEANLPFDTLHHLIEETTNKALKSGDPARVQTGPAVRENSNIMDQHKEMLANKPLWQKIYTFVSISIMEREKEKHGTF